MNILGIGRDKSQSAYFSGRDQVPEYEMEKGWGPATWPHGQAWPAPGGGLAAPSTPSASPSAYKLPSGRKP